jgi:hypothetical protein
MSKDALGNASPANAYFGTREGILARKKGVKQQTLQAREEYNRAFGSLTRETQLVRLYIT